MPDATIEQPSFKFVIETKLYSKFESEQLICHLNSFKKQDYKILLTLDPRPLDKVFEMKLKKQLNKYNEENNTNIIHKHLTFERLVNLAQEVIEDRDYDLKSIIEDYQDYCYSEGLIPDSWKRMRVQLAGVTFELNKSLNLYYDNAARGFSGHAYLGLYNQKSVRAIGKICTIVTAMYKNNELQYNVEDGCITPDMIEKIKIAIKQSKDFGYDLVNFEHRYFLLNNFTKLTLKKLPLMLQWGQDF